MEFQIKSRNEVFRIKQMNAIETLALNTQISFQNMQKTTALFNIVLERIEVKCGNDWLPVKEKDQDVFYPSGIENDLNAIDELITYFMNDYLKPIFMKSNESN